MSNVLCPLCSNKRFKNLKGLYLHQNKIYKQKNHISPLFTDSSSIYCVLCPGKSYKNQQGLKRHEALIHSNYNIPRRDLIPQPPEAISEFKKAMSLFVGVFNDNIKRYSPSCEHYYCIFSGVGAYKILGQIFGDPN
ncbi:2193_t:CDS:2 [Cetraspora pellucida]|uniref:2193_t:CDS:1 n=1 Tax=Cetraspora pellucida TaxID=1433469 RepID=A0ACA9NRX0_9GLOM|nr:2193_t:CDS:2 [Cetraspora pellucida]